MTTKEDYDLVKEFMAKNETYQKLFGNKDDYLFNTMNMILFCEFLIFYRDHMENVPDHMEMYQIRRKANG